MATNRTITIRKERFYPHPPESVWVALTDPRALAEWFEPNEPTRLLSELRSIWQQTGNRFAHAFVQVGRGTIKNG